VEPYWHRPSLKKCSKIMALVTAKYKVKDPRAVILQDLPSNSFTASATIRCTTWPVALRGGRHAAGRRASTPMSDFYSASSTAPASGIPRGPVHADLSRSPGCGGLAGTPLEWQQLRSLNRILTQTQPQPRSNAVPQKLGCPWMPEKCRGWRF